MLSQTELSVQVAEVGIAHHDLLVMSQASYLLLHSATLCSLTDTQTLTHLADRVKGIFTTLYRNRLDDEGLVESFFLEAKENEQEHRNPRFDRLDESETQSCCFESCSQAVLE